MTSMMTTSMRIMIYDDESDSQMMMTTRLKMMMTVKKAVAAMIVLLADSPALFEFTLAAGPFQLCSFVWLQGCSRSLVYLSFCLASCISGRQAQHSSEVC